MGGERSAEVPLALLASRGYPTGECRSPRYLSFIVAFLPYFPAALKIFGQKNTRRITHANRGAAGLMVIRSHLLQIWSINSADMRIRPRLNRSVQKRQRYRLWSSISRSAIPNRIRDSFPLQLRERLMIFRLLGGLRHRKTQIRENHARHSIRSITALPYVAPPTRRAHEHRLATTQRVVFLKENASIGRPRPRCIPVR